MIKHTIDAVYGGTISLMGDDISGYSMCVTNQQGGALWLEGLDIVDLMDLHDVVAMLIGRADTPVTATPATTAGTVT